jgi:hypothetical protein
MRATQKTGTDNGFHGGLTLRQQANTLAKCHALISASAMKLRRISAYWRVLDRSGVNAVKIGISVQFERNILMLKK